MKILYGEKTIKLLELSPKAIKTSSMPSRRGQKETVTKNHKKQNVSNLPELPKSIKTSSLQPQLLFGEKMATSIIFFFILTLCMNSIIDSNIDLRSPLMLTENKYF